MVNVNTKVALVLPNTFTVLLAQWATSLGYESHSYNEAFYVLLFKRYLCKTKQLHWVLKNQSEWWFRRILTSDLGEVSQVTWEKSHKWLGRSLTSDLGEFSQVTWEKSHKWLGRSLTSELGEVSQVTWEKSHKWLGRSLTSDLGEVSQVTWEKSHKCAVFKPPPTKTLCDTFITKNGFVTHQNQMTWLRLLRQHAIYFCYPQRHRHQSHWWYGIVLIYFYYYDQTTTSPFVIIQWNLDLVTSVIQPPHD